LIVVDTGFLVALLDADDRHHERCATWLAANDEPLVVPSPVVTETCCFIERDGSPEPEADFLESFGPGEIFEMTDLSPGDWSRTADLVRTYADLPLGVVDASVVAIAERLGSTQIATLDHPSLHRRSTGPRHRVRTAPMTYPTRLTATTQRSRIGYCQKHASARFPPVVHAVRQHSRRFCTSGRVNYEWITAHASDGSINRYYDPTTGQFLSVDPAVSLTQAPYSYANDDPVNEGDPLGLWGWNPISDVTQAAGDVGHYVAKHKAAIAEIAVGVVVVVGATVLTLGVGDALLAAGAAAAEESAAAAEAGDVLGSLEAVDLAVHAPFVLAPGLLLGGIGLATTGYGIYSLFGGSSGSSVSSCG
jgi:predicted nucleic acid-binding protein